MKKQIELNPWIYRGEEFDDRLIGGHLAFLYLYNY